MELLEAVTLRPTLAIFGYGLEVHGQMLETLQDQLEPLVLVVLQDTQATADLSVLQVSPATALHQDTRATADRLVRLASRATHLRLATAVSPVL